MNLADLLLDHAATDDVELLIGTAETLTAGVARARARELAERLHDEGVKPRTAVAVQLPDGPEVVVAMTAIWIAGAVFVPLNPRAPAAEVDSALAATRPAAVLRTSALEKLDAPRSYDDGVAFVTWTSGTTGRPKAILHTHDDYLELIDRVLAPLARGRDPAKAPTPNLIPVSLAMNAGIYNALFGLRAGAPLVIMQRFDTERFAALVRRHGITSTVLPPAAITMLADDESIEDLGPLRYVRSITAPLSPLGARRFADRFGVTVLNGYGQAELGEVIGWTAADARAHPDKIGAVGRPHGGVDVKIVGDDGRPLPAGEPGELLVRPPRRAVGYVAGGDLEDRIDDDGFVSTGDVARVDDDGFVWIEGRRGEAINRGGNKVYPEQVEEVLRLSARVRDAAVVGAPDRRLGEVPVAFVVGTADRDELEGLCREHLAPFKVPVAFSVVDAIPRSEIGKVLRRELAARAAELAR